MSIDPQSLARLSFTVAGTELNIGIKAPFKMWLPDPANAGSFVHKTITAPTTTINGYGHASENFRTGEVGQTLGRDWLSDYPITWYITILDGVTYWVCSRNPCMTQMPAAAGYIGDFSAEPATAATLQTNVFVAASVTVADFVDLPVWPIGTMPVQRAANSQIPTLQALTAGKDGPGLWTDGKVWTFPLGQNGAVANSYVLANAGTEPTEASAHHKYTMSKSGKLHYWRSFTGMSAASGAGAENAVIASPHTIDQSGTYANLSGGRRGSSGTLEMNQTGANGFYVTNASTSIKYTNTDIDDYMFAFAILVQAF